MDQGLAHLLTDMSTRNISWGGKGSQCVGLQPYHLPVSIVLQSGSLNLLEPSGPIQACNGIAFIFFKVYYLGSLGSYFVFKIETDPMIH